MKNHVKAIIFFLAIVPFILIVNSLPEQFVGENRLLLIGGVIVLSYLGIKYSRKED